MEIHHKVKPLHGWREFVGEVGIILLGVLLAMCLEQVVEMLHWKHRVELGRDALGGDFVSIFYNAKERELESRCLARRLEEISATLDTAGESGRLPPVGEIGSPSSRPWSVSSWDSLAADGTAAHLPRDELLNLAEIASYAKLIDGVNHEEFAAWSQLYVIVGPGRRVGDAELGDLRRAVSEAGYHAKLMRLAAFQIKDQIKQTGLRLDKNFAHDWPRVYTQMKHDMPGWRLCAPLGKAPPHYGESPMIYSLDGPIAG